MKALVRLLSIGCCRACRTGQTRCRFVTNGISVQLVFHPIQFFSKVFSVTGSRFLMKQIVWFALLMIFAASVSYIVLGANYFSTISGVQEDAEDVNKPTSKLKRTGVIQELDLRENSGIDFSIQYEDAIWMHNDSGSPTLFLIGTNGQTLAKCYVNRSKNRDWEDISTFAWKGKPYVAIADVGDNFKRRKSCQLYLIEEPKFEINKEHAVTHTIRKHKKIDFKYEDGPRDCESVVFDAKTRSIWLVEKIFSEVSKDKIPGVYQLRLNDDLTAESGIAKRVAEYSVRNATGADLHGDTLVIRNYVFAHKIQLDGDWEKAFKKKQFETVPLPIQRQGEAICFDPQGEAVFVTSEFTRQSLYRVELSKPAAPSASSSKPGSEN